MTDGAKRKDALRSVGIEDEATIDVLIASDETIVADEYLIFGQNFEANLRNIFSDYEELEGEVQAEGVDSKPFVARAVAERIGLDEEEEGWQMFTLLKDQLLAKLQ